MEIRVSEYNVINNGQTLVTRDLQKIIDLAYEKNAKLIFDKGIYLTAPLFLHSNMEVYFEDGLILLGTTNEEEIPLIDTRAAGINCKWYPAVLNIIDCDNVHIYGNGVIDGNGKYWWNKYWGEDMKGGSRAIYDKKGLRFLCDYDVKRPRNLLVQNSTNITVEDITSKESGFWNIHILYSNEVILNNIKVSSGALNSPSTDGIDIDSSYNVVVKNSTIECNDDSISIKAGRDMDGILTNIPSHDIKIINCKFLRGFGVTIGSEVSGGVYNVDIVDNSFINTDCGFRIKSSIVRKGFIKNISFKNIKMRNVKYAFHLYLNWNPAYSICKLPNGYNEEVTDIIKKLTQEVPSSIKNTVVSDIFIENVEADFDEDYQGISRAFNLEGFKDSPISNVNLNNVFIKAKEYGVLNYVSNIKYNNVTIDIVDKEDINNNVYDNR